ncbi:MAG: indole-3-glycerol phosphate synthase TrpC, partial [Pseudomonadota bacterium]
VALPVLRKDFMLDPVQIAESRALGADCVLLILAILTDDQAEALGGLAKELGMGVLVETHSADEMSRASKMGFDLIGINNRNLSTFSVSLDVSVELSQLAPQGALLVSESGISKPTDIQILRAAGLRSCLIGEAFMRQENVADAVHDLMSAAALAARPTD